MINYHEKVKDLRNFAAKLEEQCQALTNALVKDMELTIRNARDRDITLAVNLLRQYSTEGFEYEPEFNIFESRPLGEVAIMLPYNAISLCGAITIGAAYLAGNEKIFVRLPSRAPSFLEIYKRIIEATLPGVIFSDLSGAKFLGQVFADPAIKAVLCYGDDRWMREYRDLARETKTKVIFEGPGKDPFIVFADADLDKCADAAIAAGFINSGQACSSPERFYIEEIVAPEFTEKLLSRVKLLKVGKANNLDTDIGPIGSDTVLTRLKKQLANAKVKGAKILFGGEIHQIPGNRFYTCLPTIVVNCSNSMELLQDETFGPVIPIVTFTTEAEALELANESRYGLTATVYGGNQDFVARLKQSHGLVFHNTCIADPKHARNRLFWGGFKNSAWIWQWQGYSFVHKEGQRYFLKEFTKYTAESA